MNKYWPIWDYQVDWVEKCIDVFHSGNETQLCIDVYTEKEAENLVRQAIHKGLPADYRHQWGLGEQTREFFTITLYSSPQIRKRT